MLNVLNSFIYKATYFLILNVYILYFAASLVVPLLAVAVRICLTWCRAYIYRQLSYIV